MTSRVDLLGARPRSNWSGLPRWIGVTFLLGWVLILGSIPFWDRTSSLSSLTEAAAKGDVSAVHAVGGLGPRERGVATLELRWREGLLHYRAEVREARPLDSTVLRGSSGTRPDGTVAPRVRAGVVERLERDHPDLKVTKDRHAAPDNFYGDIYGLRIPAWALVLTGFLTIGGWLLIIFGPRPWHATRWAWFWVSGIGTPVGQLAYLILGGPATFGRPPPAWDKGLTGGWAFLLSAAVPIVWWALISLG